MPTALLDTNAVSDLIRDHPQVTAKAASYPAPVVTNAIVVGEVQYGLSRLPMGKRRTDLEARARLVFAKLVIEPISEQVASTYGDLKALTEAQGLNLGDNDLWIAATALATGCILVTRDQIFQRIPGLQVEDWSV